MVFLICSAYYCHFISPLDLESLPAIIQGCTFLLIKWTGRKHRKYLGEEWEHLSGYFAEYSNEVYDTVLAFHMQNGDPETFRNTLNEFCSGDADRIFRTYFSHKNYNREKTAELIEDVQRMFLENHSEVNRQVSDEEESVLYSLKQQIHGSKMLDAIDAYTKLRNYADILRELLENTWTLEGRHALQELAVQAVRKFYRFDAMSFENPENSAEAKIYYQFASLLEKHLKIERWLDYAATVTVRQFW